MGDVESGAGIKVISSNNIITGNTASNNGYGIYLDNSSTNTITGNNVSNNCNGVGLSSSCSNTITGNAISNNRNGGIRLSSSSNNNTVTGNNVSNNSWDGIRLRDSSNNTITGNAMCNNRNDGIDLYSSSINNTITGNTFVNNGLSLDDRYRNTVKDNIVNGKSLVYLEDVSNYKVEDAGQVILVNCSNITVENLDLSNTSVGIELWETEGCTISDNKVSYNSGDGIRLKSSGNNTISDNNVSDNNWHGIRLFSSSNNTITGNNVCHNNDGIDFSSSSNNNITGNNVCNNQYYGIGLESSGNNTITGNDVSNNTLTGHFSNLGKPACIYLSYSNNNTIRNNNVSNSSYDGIYLSSSCNNTITGNNVSNNYEGIRLYPSSNNNTITGNNVCKNRYGVSLASSSYNIITGNIFVNDGLLVYEPYQNTVEDNIVNGNLLVYLEDVSNYKVEDAGQVILVNCSNITVKNQDLSNTSVGIELWGTEDSTISNNKVCNNSGDGIRLKSSGNNIITYNNVCNNSDGIYLSYSHNNTITGNTVCNNRHYGIGLESSSNNTITGNNVCNNGIGILISASSNNNIISNTFVNDGLSVDGYSWQNTVEDNIVNGNPLVYLEDASDYKVEDAGQVILLNCNNITVENLDLFNTSVGIYLWETEDSIISNNNVRNNGDGIIFWNSNNNNITGNTISSNNKSGIKLLNSGNNTITGNNVCNNNGDGICLSSSNSNKIYLNNFINNINAHSYESTNIWHSTEEITYSHNDNNFTNYMGNYWSDYEEKYPDAEEIDTTGIWDIPYSIDGDEDNYPLVERFENYLTFETIRKGHYSGHNERKNYVITNNNDWGNLWNKTYSIEFPKPSLPEINFTQNMVIAVFQGVHSTGGYDIEIIKIVENEHTLEVFVKETSPGPNCGVTEALTQPYHIIKIQKQDKEIVFKIDQEVRICE